MNRRTFSYVRLPDGFVRLGMGPFRSSAEPEMDQPAFYRNSFWLDSPKPWKIPSEFYVCSPREARLRLLEFLGNDFSQESTEIISWQEGKFDDFCMVFDEIMQKISTGKLIKAVPVSTARVVTSNLFNFVQQASVRTLESSSSVFHTCWFGQEEGQISFTPELLFSRNDGILQTMALASTSSLEELETFVSNQKEIREHEAVADFLAERLGNFQEVQRSTREILQLNHLAHFITKFTLKEQTPQSLDFWIRRLHPTPALGVLPRNEQTMNLLARWREQLQVPATFGAPFGVLEPNGNFTATVQIRSLHWNAQNELTIPTGCGIVAGAQARTEWNELALKRRSILAMVADQIHN